MTTAEGEGWMVGTGDTVTSQLRNIWGQSPFSMLEKDNLSYLKGALLWVDHSPFPVLLEGGYDIHP